ncbi:MAG: hypothetical protein L7U87_02080 [Chlamydiales bacterium]|nr:hypothetical protein [Chlamydiales bacterium]
MGDTGSIGVTDRTRLLYSLLDESPRSSRKKTDAFRRAAIAEKAIERLKGAPSSRSSALDKIRAKSKLTKTSVFSPSDTDEADKKRVRRFSKAPSRKKSSRVWKRNLWKVAAVVTAVAFVALAGAVVAATVAGTTVPVIGQFNWVVCAFGLSMCLSMVRSMTAGFNKTSIREDGLAEYMRTGWDNMKVNSFSNYMRAVRHGVVRGFMWGIKARNVGRLIDESVQDGAIAKALETGSYEFLNKAAEVPVNPASKREVKVNNWDICNFAYQRSSHLSELETYIPQKSTEEKKLKEIERVLNEIPNAKNASLRGRGAYDDLVDIDNQQLMIGEVISKRLAFVAFSLLDEDNLFIDIPVIKERGSDFVSQRFKIESIFKSEARIPCWGLVPVDGDDNPLEDESVSPIVLWRGTAPKLSAEGGLASVLQNLDARGPAYSMFDAHREDLEAWLDRVTLGGEIKARTIGYSQGAALSTYTAVEFPEYLSNDFEKSPSYAWCAPGINENHLAVWDRLPIQLQQQPALVSTLTAKDPVSLTGENIVSARALFIESNAQYQGIDPKAHTHMITTRQEGYRVSEVLINEENQKISRKTFALARPVRKLTQFSQRTINHVGRTHGKFRDSTISAAESVHSAEETARTHLRKAVGKKTAEKIEKKGREHFKAAAGKIIERRAREDDPVAEAIRRLQLAGEQARERQQ